MTDSHFPASKRTIIVVDDCPDLVTIVRFLLENDGFNVMCAYNGTQLFDGLEKQKPDFILLDSNSLEVSRSYRQGRKIFDRHA